MCKHGNTAPVWIDGKPVQIDYCISGLVKALNCGGARTLASCCGHGRQPGVIALEDGRELYVAPDYETGRAIGAAFPPIFGAAQQRKDGG